MAIKCQAAETYFAYSLSRSIVILEVDFSCRETETSIGIPFGQGIAT